MASPQAVSVRKRPTPEKKPGDAVTHKSSATKPRSRGIQSPYFASPTVQVPQPLKGDALSISTAKPRVKIDTVVMKRLKAQPLSVNSAVPSYPAVYVPTLVSSSARAPLRPLPIHSWTDRALRYFEHLGKVDFSTLPLPPRVTIVNPYTDPEVLRIMAIFLREYCSATGDARRVFLFGINPGRFGAGITGVPFTDTTSLRTKLKIESSLKGGRREASGEFIWQVIDLIGARQFFSRYWITSLFPLCLLKDGKNYNFVRLSIPSCRAKLKQYDDPETFAALRPFIVRHVEEQCGNLQASPSVAICIGTGQNQRAMQEINNFYHLFDTLLCVEHPRFIVQYRRASMHAYLEKYRDTLTAATEMAATRNTK